MLVVAYVDVFVGRLARMACAGEGGREGGSTVIGARKGAMFYAHCIGHLSATVS